VLGVAAFAAALVAAFGRPVTVPHVGKLVVLYGPRIPLVVLPGDAQRLRSCHAQRSRPSAVERRVLPVACEQPPRSQVTLPNGATGALSPLLGGG
jgi:hypothetical protein